VSKNLQVVSGDAPPPDPLRLELAAAIDDRAVKADAIASARKTVEHLTAVVDKAEKKASLASIRAKEERSDFVRHLADTAKSRPPETMPLSATRRAAA
jgi:hypothetical protein